MNPAQIPPIWPFLYSQLAFPHSLPVHIISTSLSLGSSRFTHWMKKFFFLFFFLLFLSSFAFPPGLFMTVASWDSCIRPTQILSVHQGQCQDLNVTQLCEIGVCMLCLQVRISVCNHEDSQGLLAADSPQTTANYCFVWRWNDLLTPVRTVE